MRILLFVLFLLLLHGHVNIKYTNNKIYKNQMSNIEIFQ